VRTGGEITAEIAHGVVVFLGEIENNGPVTLCLDTQIPKARDK
jgi:D-Tyr-tRNAtyr deacylase